MPVMMKSLGLDHLSVAERILLVGEIWDSIADSPEATTLLDAQKHDAHLRLDAHKDSPKTGATWEEVKVRLLCSE